MKTSGIDINKVLKRIYLLILLILIIYVLLVAFKNDNALPSTFRNEKETQPEITIDRESITFIMGVDKDVKNPYYTEATNYYRYNVSGRTEQVVTTCYSLVEVRNYLSAYPPENNIPWGLINIVGHGNQWLGLSARVSPESGRANTETIDLAIREGLFPALPDSLLDAKSEIAVHGCGIGNNKMLLAKIGEAFGRGGALPKVTASKLYEYYVSEKYNGNVIKTERYEARAWIVNYKMGYKPSDHVLCRQLNEKYPGAGIAWYDVLQREYPRFTGDAFYYTFEVPVKFIIPFVDKGSIPEYRNSENQLNYIKNNSNIMAALDKIEISPEKFNWWFRTVYVKNEGGTNSPALWIKGYSTIMCVLKPDIHTN